MQLKLCSPLVFARPDARMNASFSEMRGLAATVAEDGAREWEIHVDKNELLAGKVLQHKSTKTPQREEKIVVQGLEAIVIGEDAPDDFSANTRILCHQQLLRGRKNLRCSIMSTEMGLQLSQELPLEQPSTVSSIRVGTLRRKDGDESPAIVAQRLHDSALLVFYIVNQPGIVPVHAASADAPHENLCPHLEIVKKDSSPISTPVPDTPLFLY